MMLYCMQFYNSSVYCYSYYKYLLNIIYIHIIVICSINYIKIYNDKGTLFIYIPCTWLYPIPLMPTPQDSWFHLWRYTLRTPACREHSCKQRIPPFYFLSTRQATTVEEGKLTPCAPIIPTSHYRFVFIQVADSMNSHAQTHIRTHAYIHIYTGTYIHNVY